MTSVLVMLFIIPHRVHRAIMKMVRRHFQNPINT